VTRAAKKATPLNFGHTPETIEFWRSLVNEALSHVSTPLYVFSSEPVTARIAEIDHELVQAGFRASDTGQPGAVCFRHWLSCKTQPVAPLLQWWRNQGRPIEVVSEFELRAALAVGFPPEEILVNGPAKHHWLKEFDLPGLSVHFDSPAELSALLPIAKKSAWRLGIRILTGEEFDPENPQFPTQFGFEPATAVSALRKLLRAKTRIETVHFHLRTNVSSVQVYERAIAEVAEICRTADFKPRHLDIGGGIPVRHVLTRGGKVFDGEFGLHALAKMLRQAVKPFSGLREMWLESGRFVSAGSGVLVVKILDVKERRGIRQLICDGGRTMNALTSLWEQHALLLPPQRTAASVLTAVHGPTCMAFDQLARIPLPRSLKPGDHLIWLDAGAYHIPWEIRFSHGHAAVCWHDEQGLRPVRTPQSFKNWWSQWQ
jgi:diaminopimelate decarboxylase